MRTVIVCAMGLILVAACNPPTPPPPPTITTPEIISFTVSPNPVERGSDLRIAWHVAGTSRAALWPMAFDSKLGRWFRQASPLSLGSSQGEHVIAVPGDANRGLRFELEATDAAGNGVTRMSDEIRLVCHPIFFDAAWLAWCPNPPQTTPAAFQAFEGGYMIWRADTGQVYVLLQPAGSELPPEWFAFSPTDEAANIDAPPDRYAPGEHFQRAWASLPERWRALGWAVAPEQTHTLTSQLSLSSGDYLSQNDDLFLTWPDGRVAHLRVYLSAPDHANGPAWSFVNSIVTPTSILTATPVPTQSTVPSPSSDPAHILSFEVTPAQADPGDTVMLRWEAEGDQATLCPSSRYVLFTPGDCHNVPLSGTQAFVIPHDVNGNPYIGFLLTVSAASSTATQQTQVAMKCRQQWFFSDKPQAGVCPLEPIRSQAAAQRFERGLMIWLKELGRYFVLEYPAIAPGDVGGPYVAISDPLDITQDTEGDVTPPAGFFAPASGFGLVWRGDVSQSPGFRDQLGWALEPEFSYEALYQCDNATSSGGRVWQTCYLNMPEDRVIALPSTGTWYWLGGDGR